LHVLDDASHFDHEIKIGELTYILPGVMYAIEESEEPIRRRKPAQRIARRRT
jgi:hypothetical protein